MSVICLANNKGGVGKTTSVLNLGAALQLKNKKVLLIDYDGQSNLTAALGFEKNAFEKSIYNVINRDIDTQKAILQREGGLDLIPAAKKLRSADKEFSGDPEFFFNLQESLDSFRDTYDYIIIDCPPHIGYLTYSAIIAADEIFIPVKTEYLSLEGVKDLKDATEIIKKRFNPNIKISGVFATMHNDEIRLNKAVLNELENIFGNGVVFNTGIRKNIKLAEAPSYGKTIFEYAPGSHGAEDYKNLCNDILERC